MNNNNKKYKNVKIKIIKIEAILKVILLNCLIYLV
jgi:hypothetical protein